MTLSNIQGVKNQQNNEQVLFDNTNPVNDLDPSNTQEEEQPLLASSNEQSVPKNDSVSRDNNKIIFTKTTGRTVFHLLIVFTTISLFWLIILPVTLGLIAKRSSPELVNVNISNIDSDSVVFNADLPFSLPISAPVKVSIDEMKILDTRASVPCNHLVNKCSGKTMAKVEMDNFVIEKSAQSTKVKGKFLVSSGERLGKFISNELEENVIGKSRNKVHIKGYISISSMGLVVRNIPISQFVDISTKNIEYTPKITRLERINQNSLDTDPEIVACFDITHNTGQISEINLPEMSLGLRFLNETLFNVRLSEIRYGYKKAQACMTLRMISFKNKEHLYTVEHLLNSIINRERGVIHIDNLDILNYAFKSKSEIQTTPSELSWIISTITNIKIKPSDINEIISLPKELPGNPEFSIKKGFISLDGSIDDGFSPVVSGNPTASIEVSKAEIFRGIFTVSKVAGSVSFYETPRQNTTLKSNAAENRVPLFSVPNLRMPIRSTFTNKRVSMEAKLRNTKVMLVRSPVSRLVSWVKSTMKTKTVSGRLKAKLDITFNIIGHPVVVRNVKFEIPVKYKPELERGGEDSMEKLSPQITYINIDDITSDYVKSSVYVNTINTSGMGFYLSDLDLKVGYENHTLLNFSLNQFDLKEGNFTNRINIELYTGKHISNFEKFVYTLGSGYPGCTSVKPLDAFLEDFNQTIVINTNDTEVVKSGRPIIRPVLESVKLHLFTGSLKATVVNPVFGQPIYLTQVNGSSYYNKTLIGTLKKSFIEYYNDGSINCSKCVLFKPNERTETPSLPGTIRNLKAILDLLRNSPTNKLSVDSDVYIDLLVGKYPFTFHINRNGVPVEFGF
ncbi:hypothetical protein BB560_006365 [Smittium megazygosporum]|uniref:Uncharacterized protein n=1 Tax=Smittium megazygosporum TaxID=133381 RepID=A0A2T9Y857_9FUNG|nr:hypothetical protein BB560_006365 [Smittium megazygosporum]